MLFAKLKVTPRKSIVLRLDLISILKLNSLNILTTCFLVFSSFFNSRFVIILVRRLRIIQSLEIIIASFDKI